MPDPDSSVATANQPASPAEAAARAATGPDPTPPPPSPGVMDAGAPGAVPTPKPVVQMGSAVPLQEDRLKQPTTADQANQYLNPEDRLKGESFGSRMMHGVLNALGGAQDTVLTGYDPKTGAPIYSTVASGPGSQWKRIIAGAMTGLAGASQVKGPGSPIRGLGAGYGARQQELAGQRTEQRETAQQSFQNQQEAAKNAAEISMQTNQAAESAFRLTRSKVAASQEDTDRMNKFNSLISEGGAGTRYLNHFASMDDVVKAFQQDPSLHDAHAQGQIVAVPHVNADGQIEGVDAAWVTKGWMDQKISKDLTFTTQKYEDGKLQDVTFTIPANSNVTNGDAMKLMMGQAKESMEGHWKQVQTESEAKLREKEGQKAGAEAAHEGVETELTDYELQYLKTYGYLPGKLSESQGSKEADEAQWGPGGYKSGFKPWQKEMVEPALQVERGYELANQAFNDYQAAKAQGKRLPTGAKSMLLLAQHIQNTFGMGKGTRQTQAMIEEHLHARNVTDAMTVAFNKFLNGDVLSDQQWNDFHELISQSRDAAWEQVIKSGQAIGRPLDKAAVPADMMKKYATPAATPPAAPPGRAAPPAPGGRAAAPAPPPAAKPTPVDQLPPEAIQAIKARAGQPTRFKGQPGTYIVNQAGQIVLTGG